MTRWSVYGCAAVTLALLFVVTTTSPTASASTPDINPLDAPDPIPDIWLTDDSEQARAGDYHTWIWGPSIRAAAEEPYEGAPDGMRRVFYFDKARMEINNPEADPTSEWYATTGLLVREMILGRIQTSESAYIHLGAVDIPVTGDTQGNELSPTYAVLAEHTSIGPDAPEESEHPDRTGEHVSDFMAADGSIDEDAVRDQEVKFGHYETKRGHNIPDVFWDWMNDQGSDWLYMTGYPITEPYWVETRIDGEPQQVLMQAFERRIVTYTAANEPGWQVETGNSGLHYKRWRGIEHPIEIEPRDDRATIEEPSIEQVPEPAVDLRFVDSGPAAYYSPSYDRAWWDYTIGRHAGWGNAVAGWSVDPNGHYCVHPDYRPGQRLQLRGSNGTTLWCTIGDSVAAHDEAQWRAKWSVELRWDTFKALGLDYNNYVEVYAP